MRRFLGMLAVIGACACAAEAHAEGAVPDVQVGVGQTFAVNGTPDDGGLAGSLDLAWPVSPRWRIGVRAFAEDLGTTLGQVDPSGGAAGTFAESHRACWGVSWLGEAGLWRRGPWLTTAALEWGGHRIQDDRRGYPYRAITAVGTGLTLSAGRDLGSAQSLALALRWRQVFVHRDGDVPGADPASARAELPTGWASAALVWGYRAH